MDGVLVVVVVLALAGAFGIYRQKTEGTVKAVQPSVVPAPVDHGIGELGERGTILQFSSAFCQPCKAAKVISKDIANIVPGVKHIDIDAESNLELVRTFNVMRTPTIFVLNRDGQVSAKISGVPRKEELLIALDDRSSENI